MEDWGLLNSLGVTSVKPEDIERRILEQGQTNTADCIEAGRNPEEDLLNGTKSNGTSSASLSDQYNKLQAVKIEIDAVRSAFELENDLENETRAPEGEEQEHVGGEGNLSQAPTNGKSLQHALASDRLRSLIETKAQLEQEISEVSKDGDYGSLIKSIVKDDRNSKRRLKEVRKSSKQQSKRVKRASLTEDDDFDSILNAASAGFVETERDELVRKGIFTPFTKLKGFERRIQEPGSSSRHDINDNAETGDDFATSSIARAAQSMSEAVQARPTTKLLDFQVLPKHDAPTYPFQRLRAPLRPHDSPDTDGQKNKERKRTKKRPLPDKKWRKLSSREEISDELNDARIDGDECVDEDVEDDVDEENTFVSLEGGLKIPETIFSKLFDYQKVGVQWLWELHCQRAGGIIGDEMGLGKTIQVITFLGSLHFSSMYKPSIIICPVTLLRQWKREVQKWYPRFHVEILHDSAQDVSSKKKQDTESDCESDDLSDNNVDESSRSRNRRKWDALINRIVRSQSGLLITTYEQLRLLGEKLLDVEWGYAVLDEGHRIRNPNAEITLVCKQLQTVHRIIMTGAPIQNKLSELWSLFDFVFPGKLGVLPIFEAEFAVPISVGGYANASPLQVSTAYRCAVVLRDLIMPYLLRRMKADVNAQLPKKTEHVLFCSLTEEQRSVYRAFLASSEVEQILDGNRNSLSGIDVMRKICNHPDLLEREHSCKNPDYGNPERSGKMKVVAQVLQVWKEQGHRVLLFAQTQQMLDIVENFLVAAGYSYRRMDGSTPVKQRMALLDEFNNSNDVFVFILTTKVGGLGTNLTGADRVIIFDPDWNPSTDMQARERAWRIGQKKDVTVYRLITRGTIEEKVYHRQIYKHFLTNKILSNPQQRRLFKARDLKDLFTLADDVNGHSTETSNIFSQLSEYVNVLGTNDSQIAPSTSEKVNCSTGDRQKCSDAEDEGGKMDDCNQGEIDEETNILRSLFDAQGIHSAMNHDAIMNSHDEEKLKLEQQASQVAQRAAEALRQSRMLRSRENVAIPTWTGKSGAAGAPSAVGRKFGSTVSSQLNRTPSSSEDLVNRDTKGPNSLAAGASSGKALSSAELLARIRGNQEGAVNQGLEHQFSSGGSSSYSKRRSVASKSSGVQPEVLIRQLCTFIQSNGGSSDSGSIVNHFRDKIPEKDLPVFKNLLKEIATLEKHSGGSFWVLKPEYQE